MLGTTCLSFEERSWFQLLFEKFASRLGHWSESDLISFLVLSFPEPSTQLIREAGPILYRLLLCVGSYPYHQDPVNQLDLETLRTAITLLLGNDERSFLFTEDEEEENERASQIRARYSRLLFQSLAIEKNFNTGESSERNDEDLKEALHIISQRRVLRHPIRPKIGTRAPELPPPSSLPPAHAEALSGRLTQSDLQILIRLFLACQLHWAGIGPEQIVASPSDGLEKATNAIIGAFNLEQEGLCAWESFHQVIARLRPGIQSAMACILPSFIKKPSSVNEDEFVALPLAEASKLICANHQKAESDFVLPGMILSLPLLCHLAMFLPEESLLDRLKLISQMNGEAKMMQTITTHINNSSLSSLLLISGYVQQAAHSSATNLQIICGAFLPSTHLIPTNSGNKPIIFQCEPKHCVWPGVIDRTISSLRGDLVRIKIALRLDAGADAYVELQLDSQLRKGLLSFPTNDMSNLRDEISFCLDIIEVLDVPSAFD